MRNKDSDKKDNNQAVMAGDFAIVSQAILNYLDGKGQIFSAAQIASIIAIDKWIKETFFIDLGLENFVNTWIGLSEIERARWDTVAQKNAEIITKISTQINYVEQKQGFTKLFPIFGKKKK